MKKIILPALVLLLLMSCAEKPYVIVQIADAQLGFTAADRSQKEGTEYVNDLTYESECLSRAVTMVNGLHPDAVVFTGDQVNSSANEEQWDKFAEIISGIDRSVKVFHLPGNHDVHINGDKVDPSPFASRYGDDRFIHSDREVNLVGLNTNLIKAGDERAEDQVIWLKDILGATKPEETTIIFGHHPFFLTDIDEPDSYFPLMKDKRRFYFDMFSEFGVDAVYAGHRHDSFEGEYNGIPMKTTTSVGFQIGTSQPSIRVITVTDGTVSDTLLTL